MSTETNCENSGEYAKNPDYGPNSRRNAKGEAYV